MSEQNGWSPDVLDGFEARCLSFPDDYEGEVFATLVRRQNPKKGKKAVLYIHGYMDYFFQTHLAEAYLEQGYHFYALDLRKYGRSLRQGQRPNYCKAIQEYFAEISEALRIMHEDDGNEYIVLNGHSTGGLSSALYAATGEQRRHIKALILNSPFLQFNLRGAFLATMRFLAWVSPLFPYISVAGAKPLPYIESIHKKHQGEWDFSLDWRKLEGFPIYSGWVAAIFKAHEEVYKTLNIECPVLVLHSDKSIYGESYNPSFQTGDAVLSVTHIREHSKHLGKNVKLVEIKDGLHDLVLSRHELRDETFGQMFSWLNGLV